MKGFYIFLYLQLNSLSIIKVNLTFLGTTLTSRGEVLLRFSLLVLRLLALLGFLLGLGLFLRLLVGFLIGLLLRLFRFF